MMPVITPRGLEYVRSEEFADELSFAATELKLEMNELGTLFYITAIQMCELPEGAATHEELSEFIFLNFAQIHKITIDALEIAARPWTALLAQSPQSGLLN
jgi:hypothetical protein